jgi:hypothetical protein
MRHSTSACSCGTPKFVFSGAPAARANAHLDAVHAALGQIPGAFGRRDVAGNHLDVAESSAEGFDGVLHHDRMSMRDVDHQHVHAGLDELGRTLEEIAFGADRRANSEPAL